MSLANAGGSPKDRIDRLRARFASSRVRDAATFRRDQSDRAQVCIVGTGAGGAAVAHELIRRGHSVVLLEEGGLHLGDELGETSFGMHACARDVPTLRTGGATIRLETERCVGGTTVLGAGTYERISEATFDAWAAEHGLQELRGSALEPYYDRVERDLAVAPVPEATYGRNAELLELGARQMGLAGARIARGVRGCIGTGVCMAGCPQDAKQAMHVSYIPEVLEHGAALYLRARAAKILVSEGRAFGVIADCLDAAGRPTGHHLRIVAERLVLACGALATPLLLARGAVGRTQRHLGRHLHLHPMVRVSARFPSEVRGWAAVPEAYAVRALDEEGITIRSHFAPPAELAMSIAGLGADHKRRMETFARIGSFSATIRDESEGSVRAGRGDRAIVRYRPREADVRKIVRAVSATAELAFAAGAEEVYPAFRSMPGLVSSEEARAVAESRPAARELDLEAWSPVGTARMSNDPSRGVTDWSGRVHGVRDLYVADASLFPGSCSARPQLTILALGLRIGEELSAGLGAPL